LVIGARIDFTSGESVLVYPTDRAAYGGLSRLISLGRRRAPKGECHLDPGDLIEAPHAGGMLVALLPPAEIGDGWQAHARELARAFAGRCWLVAHAHLTGRDADR